jgi:hypothetical protein
VRRARRGATASGRRRRKASACGYLRPRATSGSRRRLRCGDSAVGWRRAGGRSWRERFQRMRAARLFMNNLSLVAGACARCLHLRGAAPARRRPLADADDYLEPWQVFILAACYGRRPDGGRLVTGLFQVGRSPRRAPLLRRARSITWPSKMSRARRLSAGHTAIKRGLSSASCSDGPPRALAA